MSNYKNKEFPNANIYEQNCPTLYALDIIDKKWCLPILWYISENQVARYGELSRKIVGITGKMLAQSLKSLEQHKLINRTEYYTIPPKVEYSLTERGESLLSILYELYLWGEEQIRIDNINI